MWRNWQTRMNKKYTKEALEAVVHRAWSVSEVIRLLEGKSVGGNVSYMSGLLRRYGIDTSHFYGKRNNRGEFHQGGPRRLIWSDVLILQRLDHKEKTFRLRRAMIEAGIPYLCGMCGIEPFWNGKELVVQIDHKNGESEDNRKHNLRFLCPNCHSQTTNWALKTFHGKWWNGRHASLRSS